MPLKLPKLPDTHAVHLTVTIVKYALFVVALAAVGSFLPDFLRSKKRIPEGNRRMRPALGSRTIFSWDLDARIAESDPRAGKAQGHLLRRGDVLVLGEGHRREDIIVRVVALPGDTVTINRTGDLLVNGESEKKHYLDSYASPADIKMRNFARPYIGAFFVPRGYLYCLTDERGTGENRNLGLTSLREIRGKLVLGPRDRGN